MKLGLIERKQKNRPEVKKTKLSIGVPTILAWKKIENSLDSKDLLGLVKACEPKNLHRGFLKTH